MRERARVHGGVLRRPEARRGSGQRELPLRRRRARVPARQLRRASRSCSTTSSRRRSPTRSPHSRPNAARGAAAGRARRRRTLLDGARDYDDALAARPTAAPTDREPSGDDLVFLYTGGTTGYPKAVMWRSDDLYVVAVADGAARAPNRPTSRHRSPPGKQAATLLPACPLMHGTGLFITLSTLVGRRHRRAARHAAARSGSPCGARSSASTSQVCTIVGDAFARPLLAALDAEPEPIGTSRPARDHVVGRHVEPGDEARAARAPSARHADRLARRVGRDHDAHRDARGRRHRAGPLQGERTHRGRDRRRRRRAARATDGSACSVSAARSRSATTRIPRRPRRRSARSAGGATRSRATTRRSTPTARSACSAGARRASTPAARRCTPRRSSSCCERTPTCSTASSSGVPDDRWGEMVVALVQAARRHGRSTPSARRALPRDARGVQGAEAVRRARLAAALAGGQGRLQAAARASPQAHSTRERSYRDEHVAGQAHPRGRR